jgi:hypothetical protein
MPDVEDWLAAARRGDFARAWAISDDLRTRVARFGDPRVPRHEQTIWNGTPIAGRHVLVRCYHGLGDTIHFARYLPWIAASARRTVVWAQPELLPLLQTIDAPLTLLPLHEGDVGVPYEVDLEIMEAAYVFRSTLETLPADVPYLHVGPLPLPARSGGLLRVGVIWRGGPWDPRRSMPLARLRPLLDDPRIDWFSLQPGCGPDECHPRLHPFRGTSIADTAGWLQSLDLLISVDTMGAHLAGALGRPVWTLLQHEADWRWLTGRADSPWYPTMRLFRQREPGRWDEVLEAVRRALSALPARTTAYSSPRHWDPPTAAGVP